MQQQRYALGTVILASLLPFFGWATDWDTPGGPAGRLKPGPHGPFRNDPAQGIPKHAYSPFENIGKPPPYQPTVGRDFLPGRVVVKLKPPALARTKSVKGLPDVAALQQKFAAYGLTSAERVFPDAQPPANSKLKAVAAPTASDKPDLTRWLRAACPTNVDVQELVKTLAADPDVDVAEPEYIRRLSDCGPTPLPNGSDPRQAQQWHLAAAHVPEAWNYLQSQGLSAGGCRDIVVAVIDTGVDYNHPDLAANMWVNSREIAGNGIDDDNNGFVDDVHGCNVVGTHSGNPMDDHGHGTHVAGIIAAQANNGQGGVGVAYNVQIMAIKAAQYSGVLAATDIAEGINYAVANGADIINMSFGGYAKSQVEEDALTVAFGQCVLVAAAGNDGRPDEMLLGSAPMYPAAYNWVLGVMARTQTADSKGGYLAGFSNFDVIPQNLVEYELMAPGVDVWSALPNAQYAAWDGTSMATPVVSGIAALARTKWSDKDVYSSRFIMGQIATTGALLQGRTLTDGTVLSYHSADAQAALTTYPTPRLSYLEHWLFDTTNQAAIDDNDGRVDAGETIDLAIVIRNQWGKASNVVVTLDAWADGAVQADPYVTWLTNVVDYGAIGAFNWDDNGLIYNNQVITGVRYPFRFQVSSDCPNDHIIPFRVNMACRNGFDPSDTSNYTFQSRFSLLVQRGKQLPRIISRDTTLTKDDFWILSGPILVEHGVTLTVTEGAQIQFDGFYAQVEGSLIVEGTPAEPVEMFVGSLHPSSALSIDCVSGALVSLRYARLQNPVFRSSPANWPSGRQKLNSIDHCYFDQPISSGAAGTPVCMNASSIQATIFSKLGGSDSNYGIRDIDNLQCCLFDSCYIQNFGGYAPASSVSNTVFLLNYRNLNGPYSQVSQVVSWGTPIAASSWTNDDAFKYGVNRFKNNAFLNRWVDGNPAHWMSVLAEYPSMNGYGRNWVFLLSHNFWATASPAMIDQAIYDYNDNFNYARVDYLPVLNAAPATAYPFVVDVKLSTPSGTNVGTVGVEPVSFGVSFNRDMDTNTPPQVSFGPADPYTDYSVPGGWQDARTWMGTFNVNPITGDGYQLMRIAGARAANDPWLVCGEDSGRFRFEIITSGTESMNLQALGGEGKVDLSWMQDDFELLAGYNLYRSPSANGSFTRINTALIPSHIKTYSDTGVTPGQPYFYKFTVVKTDMSEAPFSNLAQGTPLDTIPPVLTHTPVSSAAAAQNLTIAAVATDNVGVQGVTLYFRAIGAASYTSRAMTLVTGNQYATTIEGSRIVSPGIEYYIEATDGVTPVRSPLAGPSNPYSVTVLDRPVVTVVTPSSGSASGGTAVTIAGSSFKAGAAVSFGGVAANSVTVVSANQITCMTAAHFPATVDVVVANSDGQTGTLLRGFTYVSDVVSLSLPNTGGSQLSIVQVPLNAANLQGLAAASLTVTFDPAVLRGRTARTGSLTAGWSLVPNTNTAGQMRLSMASSGPTSSGSGTLASLEFEVLGAPGASTTLVLSQISLNGGAVLVQPVDGSFAVNQVYNISGTVRYWNGNAGVGGVTCTLQGDRVYTGQSGAGGAFTVAGADAGTYTLTPTKSDGVNGISAYDASLVLQHDARLITLSGRAATAADVDKSGTIDSMDAYYILQASVGNIALPFPGAGAVWQFDPPSRSYSSLNSSQANQDFTAILLGDVSGNWTNPVADGAKVALKEGGKSRKGDDPPVTLALRALTTRSNETEVWLVVRATKSAIYSVDLSLSYTLSHGLKSVRGGPLAGTLTMSSNTNQAGLVRVALAGAVPLRGIGGLLVLTLPEGTSNDLQIVSASVNEGAVQVAVDVTGAGFDQDTDRDGQTDWAEIRAGTDPTDSKSFFAIRSVTVNGDGSKTLTWSSVAGKTYQVWFKDEAAGRQWLRVGGEVTATGDKATLVDRPAIDVPNRLYRIQLLEQEIK